MFHRSAPAILEVDVGFQFSKFSYLKKASYAPVDESINNAALKGIYWNS